MTNEEAARILDPETSREALAPWLLDCEGRMAIVEEACRIGAEALRAQLTTVQSQNEQLREAAALTVKATTDRLCREWVSVEERLPGVGATVLVCDYDGHIETGERNESGWIGGWLDECAAYWMPLPELPKEVE